MTERLPFAVRFDASEDPDEQRARSNARAAAGQQQHEQRGTAVVTPASEKGSGPPRTTGTMKWKATIHLY